MSFKQGKVVMLPTNEKAKLWVNNLKQGKLNISEKELYFNTAQHLYITSDDEIKEGDWCYLNNNIKELPDYNGNYIIKISKEQVKSSNILKDCKKIIATTDSSLKLYESETLARASGFSLKTDDILLPQPSHSFIQEYVEEYNKGNIITDVLVEYDMRMIIEGDPDYFNYDDGRKLNKNFGKLKINPKDNTITIKKVKDSWSRDEVVEFAKKYGEQVQRFTGVDNDGLHCYCTLDKDKWIEENL